MALRTQMSQRSLRNNSEPDPGEGEWIEHRVGPAMSLVRRPTFRSPAGFRRQYSTHMIQVEDTALDTTMEEQPQSESIDTTQTEQLATPQKSSTLTPMVRSRPKSSLHNHRPARCQPVQRPKSSMSRSLSAASPDILKCAELPRPKTSQGILTLATSESRPQTASGVRKAKTDEKPKRSSKALPPRVPLRPMSAAPSETFDEDFLQMMGLAGEEGLPRASSETGVTKVQSLRFLKPERSEGPMTAHALRNRTSLRYVPDESTEDRDPRRVMHVRTAAAKPEKKKSPEAYQRLKNYMPGVRSEKRLFWNNQAARAALDLPMPASTAIMIGRGIKGLQNRATAKLHDEHEFIKAMLHREGKQEAFQKNAEDWLAGVDSLLDKRAQLRMYEVMQYTAQQGIREAQIDINTTNNLLGLQKGGEAEVKDLEQRLAAAKRKQLALETQIQVAKAQADIWTVSLDELDAVKPGTENAVGGTMWNDLREEIGKKFPDEDAKDNMFRDVQNSLDTHRKGWWREDFPAPSHELYGFLPEEKAMLKGEANLEDSTSSSSSFQGGETEDFNAVEDMGHVLFRTSSASARPGAKNSPRAPKQTHAPEIVDPWREELHQDPVWVRKSRDEELRLEALIQSRPYETLAEQEENRELQRRHLKKQIAREHRELYNRRNQPKLMLWPTDSILDGFETAEPDDDADAEDESEQAPQEEATDAEAAPADANTGAGAEKDGEEGADEHVSPDAQESAQMRNIEIIESGVQTLKELQAEEKEKRLLKDLIVRSKHSAARFELAKALRFPGLVKALHTWYDKYIEAERYRRGQVKAYDRMCTFLKMPSIGLGTWERFVYDSNTDSLKIPGFNLSSSHMTVMCCLFKGEDLTREDEYLMPTLKLRRALDYVEVNHINCANNNIRGPGTHQLVNAVSASNLHLLSLNVSFNALGEDGAAAIANLFKNTPSGETLEELDVSRNLLGDFGLEKVALAISKVKSPALKKLSFQRNEGKHNAGWAIGKLLQANTSLQDLDLSWNQLHGDGAVHVADGLQQNKTLKSLHLQWNALGDRKSCGAIATSLHGCKLEFLNLSENRIGSEAAFLLAEGLESNVDIKELALNGNPLTMQGAREILKTNGVVREKVEGNWNRKFQLTNCGVGIIAPAVFDPAEPAGQYQLDMKDPVNHRVMKNLIKLSKKNKGMFDRRTAIITEFGEKGRKIKTTFRLEFESDDPEEWILPDAGLLEFNFADKRKPPSEHALLSADMMSILIKQLIAQEETSTSKVDYVHATVGGSYMSYEQLVELLSYIPPSDTVERVNLVSRCFHRLANVDDPRKALNLLVGEERAMAEKQLGTASFAFFKNNATGFHRLDLSKHAHRDVAERLVGLYNAMEDELVALSAYYDGRAGGKRDLTGIGLIWRNSKLDGVPFTFTPYWSIPYSGTLEVDFVDIRKPPPTAEAMSDETFKELVLDKWDQKSSLLGLDLVSPSNKLKILREASNMHYFNCYQIAHLLAKFKSAKQANIRIEIVITCWTRTIDWHGLANILQVLTPFEYRVVVHRLGYVNVFDEVMAVSFWDLDLSMTGERFVFQELYHLAMNEHGQSIVNPSMNGVDTVIPDTWVSGGVPEHGKITFFFCRQQLTIERVFKFGAIDHEQRKPDPRSLSTFVERYMERFCAPGYNSPSGKEWIHPYRCRRIRRKLMEKFDRPQTCFNALDKDKSGSLTRSELSVGLVAVGIWLHPDELEQLLHELDKDGGGSVELAEFVEFWNSYSPQALI